MDAAIRCPHVGPPSRVLAVALGVLLPLARFPGLLWFVAGFLLPRQRPRTTP